MLQLSYVDWALLGVAAFAAVGMLARLMLEENHRLLSDIRHEIEEERLRIEREKRLELRPKVEDEYESGSDQNSAPNSDAA